MSYQSLTAVLPGVILFAGILLAVSMLAIPLYNPLFAQDDGTDGTIEYAENGMGPVATFMATDPEGKTPVWSLLDDAMDTQDIDGDSNDDVDADDIADEDLFSIDESSGVLTFNSPPNFEAPVGGTAGDSNTYMVVVQASDGEKESWKKVEVEVTNEDEDATTGIEMSSLQPQVSTPITVAYVDGVGNPFVDSNGAANTAIVDPDNTDTMIGEADVKWQWSRSSSRTGAYSEITGDVAKTVPYTPDSTDESMYLRVTATYEDGEGEGKTVMATSVYPVRPFRSGNSAPAFPEDFDTEMTGPQGPMAEADDGAMDGDEVGDRVTANDANSDRLTYSLVAKDGGTPQDADVFRINRMTGQVTVGLTQQVNPTSDDAEQVPMVGKGDSFTVTIMATDPSGSPDTVDMTIMVVDETDEAPVFTMGETSHMHAENTDAMTVVYTFTAYEPEGDTVSYSLSGADMDKFTITINDGALTFDASPDFEMPGDAGGNNVYNVMVKAVSTSSTDGATEKSTTLNVMVTVTNVDDDGMVELSAAQPRIGVEIRAINLMDPDGMMSGTTWQWERDDDGTPTVDCTASLTWEDAEGMGAETAAYTPEEDDEGKCLRVTATYTDAQGAGKASEAVSTQSVQKVRNLAPMFTDEDAETAGIQVDARKVAENSAAPTNVGGPVVATDTEDGEGLDDESIAYSLSGADAASFEISSESDSEGQIQVGSNAMLNFEATKNTYMVTVTATDLEGLNSSVDVTIMVTGVDEAPDLEGPSNRDFTENGMGPVATFMATDPEGKTPVWSLLDDAMDTQDIDGDSNDDVDADDIADEDLFSIDESSGVLTFNSPPNFEAPVGGTAGNSNTYMVVVQASDGEKESWKKVEVEVTNEDEDATTGDRDVVPSAPGLDPDNGRLCRRRGEPVC